MQNISVFLDTNVLVYAHDEFSLFHEKSALLLDLAIEKEITGIISEQNVIELYRVITNETAMSGRPLSPSEAKTLIEDTYLSVAFTIAYPTRDTLEKTIEIAARRRLSSARIFDVRLYTVALEQKPTYFVTYNAEDFRNFGDLAIKTPDEIL